MNPLRFWIAICFFISQNNYFGWNALPQSDVELIADGITMLLVTLAFTGESNA